MARKLIPVKPKRLWASIRVMLGYDYPPLRWGLE